MQIMQLWLPDTDTDSSLRTLLSLSDFRGLKVLGGFLFVLTNNCEFIPSCVAFLSLMMVQSNVQMGKIEISYIF